MGGVFPKTTNRLSKFKCKAPFNWKFKNGVLPPGWVQIDTALMNLITNWLQINYIQEKII